MTNDNKKHPKNPPLPKKNSKKSGKTGGPHKADPHKTREAEKYANPIASREFLLAYLDEHNKPITHLELADALKLTDPDNIEALRRRLIAMSRDGQLVSNRRGQYTPVSRVSLLKGVVIGHRDGFGFVKLDEGGSDLYLSARQMQTVFDGDRVLVRADSEDHRGKRHAIIIEILEHNTTELVGRIYQEGKSYFVEVENTRVSQKIMIDAKMKGDAKHGQYVVVEILHQPTKRTFATGKVIDVLGDHLAPGMEIDVAIRSYGLPFQWPADVVQAIEKLKPEVMASDKQQRIDITHLPLVTIDGEDARDFDDAVYCEKLKGSGWRLYVAIADVSHYVQPESPLDLEASTRATSVYFPDYVLPMLPEILSNGLCSLNPEVDRLCMVCEMEINQQGIVTSSCFYEGVMFSHARLTYNQVGEILEQPESDEGKQLQEDFSDLLPHLHDLYALYHALQAQRKIRGAIDFETVETRIIFDQDRKIEAIVPTVRNDAHKIIEECMLCANVATAEFLARHKLPTLYRIHDGPTKEKLENVRSFLGEQGLQLMGGETPSPSDYQQIIAQIQDRPDFSVLQTILLRSMSQAVYGPEEKGHFGLAYEHYAHFTSPIRRYPDLLVHRAIKSVIYAQKNSNEPSFTDVRRPEGLDLSKYKYLYDLEKMLVLGEQCSMAERRADEATRDVNSWLKCEYLQQHLGEVFEGIISGVTGFGFFVELADLYVEGLVHVSALNSDYYQYDAPKHRLIGERTGSRFGLGDKVVVEVTNINLEERKVDLMLVSAEPRAKARRRPSKKTELANKKSKSVKRSDSKQLTKKPGNKKPVKKKSVSKESGKQNVSKRKVAKKTNDTGATDKTTRKPRKRNVKSVTKSENKSSDTKASAKRVSSARKPKVNKI